MPISLRKAFGKLIQRIFGTDVTPSIDFQDEYRYTVLEYAPALGEETRLPVLVLIEAPLSGGEGIAYCGVGRSLTESELETANELGRHILSQLSSWLESQLNRAIENSDTPLKYLSAENNLNLTFRKPVIRESSKPFQEVWELYREEVLEELPGRVREELEETSAPTQAPEQRRSRRVREGAGQEADISIFRPPVSSSVAQPA